MSVFICLVFTINEILILSNLDFLKVWILFFGSDAIIKVNENALFVTEKLCDGESVDARN